MAKNDLTASRVRELFNYDPETGIFTRRTYRGGKRAGTVAGTPQSMGYTTICVDYCYILAHRLAWLYVHGEWPKKHIDHIDGVKTNNSIANLRDVTVSVNLQNLKGARSDNRNGYLGVSPNRKRWRAEICITGKRIRLGTFDSPELAHAAYLKAKRDIHDGCTI